jgi:hypothetical protein
LERPGFERAPVVPKKKIAVAWLREKDWSEWRSIDPSIPSYNLWSSKMREAICEAERRGIATMKVLIEPNLFTKWCRENGRPAHRYSRTEYAATRLMARMGR